MGARERSLSFYVLPVGYLVASNDRFAILSSLQSNEDRVLKSPTLEDITYELFTHEQFRHNALYSWISSGFPVRDVSLLRGRRCVHPSNYLLMQLRLRKNGENEKAFHTVRFHT